MESDLGWVEEWGEKGKRVGEMMRWMVEVFRVNGEEGEGGREGGPGQGTYSEKKRER